MRREVALTGGAALAAGLLLGFVAERLVRLAPAQPTLRSLPTPARGAPERPRSADGPAPTDVLDRYRAAAAV